MRRWKLYKYLHFDLYGLGAICLIAHATVLRLLLISNWPVLNSDEGTMGLMALHLVNQSKIPLFFYGQGYVGSLEAILASPLFLLFGPSHFTLRLGSVFLYALFLLNMYLLTSIIYSKPLALFTLLVLSFGSESVLSLQLSATGGHPDMLFVGSLLLLYALLLARSASEAPLEQGRRRRILAYTGWGLLAGLALWIDPLLFPYVVSSGWLLWRFAAARYSEPLPSACCSFSSSYLYRDCSTISLCRSPVAHSLLGAAYWSQGTALQFAPLLIRIAGTLFVALPRVTGGTVVCNVPPASGLSLFTPQHNPAAPCNIVQILWGIGFLTLTLTTAVMAYTSYRVLRRAERLQAWTLEERREAIGYFTQLMLVLSPLLILIVYATTSSAGLDPWYSARYLTSTLIALPAFLWPIWRVGTDLKSKPLASSIKVLSPLLLLVIFLFFTVGWVQTLNLIPAAQDVKRQEADLIQALLNRGITHIYTDYWTCDRIAFESTERIICSVVDEQLQPGVNRYTPYTTLVNTDSYASWVFPVGSPQARAFEQNMQKSGESNPSFIQDGYIIFMPITPATVGQYKSEIAPRFL